jgi:transcriptional regulator
MAHGYELYAGADEQAALELLERAEYGHLAAWEGERPSLTFMHYVCDRAARRIEGHLANSNPLLQRLEREPRVTFTVSGPAAYIPSYWVDPERGVPTSYYSWAQFELEVRLVREPQAIVAVLGRMLARFQPEGRHPPLDLGQPYWRKLVGAITALDMRVIEARSRFKYGQNRPAALRRAIAQRLQARSSPQDPAVSQSVLAHLSEGVQDETNPDR